jgi:hypothetical protein
MRRSIKGQGEAKMGRHGSKVAAGEAKWREHFEAQAQSGLSVRQYCEDNALAAPTFYYWKRRLAKPPKFVEIVACASPEPSASAGIEVVLGRGRRLVLQRGFCEQTLVRVVRALEGETGSC